ncbi:hypothetical protein SAMN05216344_103248 [Polaromonas sp. OV174]|nr:hypothetical protein SAMN05216344_103248 [Polaromonas sp. OV174]
MSDVAPTLVASRTALPPEGAAAPAARLSRFRGPCWLERRPPLRSHRLDPGKDLTLHEVFKYAS